MSRTLEEWIQKSYKIPGVSSNHFLLYDFQALGKTDCLLNEEWKEIGSNLSDKKNILRFDFHATLSRLWVIAGYEFVREINKIDERVEVNQVHENFRRLRIAMVKYEVPDSRNGVSYPEDFGGAYLYLSQFNNEIGWAIAPNVFVSRNQLAEDLYGLFS